MVYTVYETNCIIFELKNIQENDVLIKAFSDKFGIIHIIAKSLRKNSSKLKGNIKDLSINTLSIVKGKEFFILTDANHLFSFTSSKSIFNFLKNSENLFFNDEREYFDDINKEIYNTIIHLCRFIIYIVKSNLNDKKEILDIINIFFTVYIRGLQGFVEKVNMNGFFEKEGLFLYEFLKSNKDLYKNNLNKIKLD